MCVFLFLPPPPSPHCYKCSLSPPCSVSISLSPSISPSDIHSNDPCLSHAGTMLWIPSKQKNKWRLLCKWLCGGTCAGVETGKKMVMFVSSYVCVGRKPEQEEQERSGCNKKKKGCRGEESKERRMQTGWPDAMFLWRSITSNRALSLYLCVKCKCILYLHWLVGYFCI